MRFGMEPSRDLGLQHALRNGIALLDGRDTGQDRGRVLDGLLEIVTEADRGSGALQEHSLTFALSERSAFERYSLFDRYLSGSVADLPHRLAEARDVLQRVGQDEAVPPVQTASVEDLLARLLSALERDRNLTPLATVRDVHYN
ncbi:MAG: hypothetical protein WC804_06330 [Sphingomonas sp.]|jgi:hypothetical protein|uniref:hypothetical protein n=1 Tax=Sphingomonas sp. TaxID=28214 RepID=UPI003362EF07